MLQERVLLAKYLYRKGEQELQNSNPIAPGVGISLLQDAAESLLWTIAKHLGESPKKDTFYSLIDCIEAAPKASGRKIAHKGHLDDLNKARVAFKHNGIKQAPEEARRLGSHCLDFLKDASRDFLGIDFDLVSMAEMVGNLKVKRHLIAADSAYSQGNWKECVTEAVKAQLWTVESARGMLTDVDSRLSDFYRMFDAANRDGARAALTYIAKYLSVLRNAVLNVATGTSHGTILRFKQVVEADYLMENGDARMMFKKEPTQEDARFFLDFVLDYALTVQRIMS